ncbi:hypothetical protein MOV65_10195 [Neorhizobium sp. SHOUNA12B]|nr:hypothetical protein [Neorhizobium sp. SHOUNA12B]
MAIFTTCSCAGAGIAEAASATAITAEDRIEEYLMTFIPLENLAHTDRSIYFNLLAISRG